MQRTFENLFNIGFVPIVNGNDSIATSEIKYGDNDRLALEFRKYQCRLFNFTI